MPILQLNGQNLQLNGLDLYLNGVGDADNLSATSISSQSSVGTPALAQKQVLLANDITAASSVSVPALNGVVSGGEEEVAVGGHWRGKGGKKGRKYDGQPQRIRLLSELDPPKDEPLFTVEDVLKAEQVTIDENSRSLIMDAALASVQNVNNILAKQRELDLRREREDEFMLMQ
jgi:hypothetical protein